jgi:antitoxin (DNA-binding transcriptional repressor) of toxin-antitoxin stability system
MHISVTDTKGQLTDLVRRAEAGDKVVLKAVPDLNARRRILEAARASGVTKATPGPDAARSQDFLYGED